MTFSSLASGLMGVEFGNMSVLELPQPCATRQFSERRLLTAGRYSKVYASRHVQSGCDVALKCVHKITTKKQDFLREFHCNYYLSSHPNIVKSFDEAFETTSSYYFAQELAPYGDLSRYVRMGGLEEVKVKCVVKQLAFALEFLHNRGFVHFDVCLQNIFVFHSEMSLVKLGDFGNTQRVGVLVKRKSVRLAWAPPEVNQTLLHSKGYLLQTAQDAWQLGVLIFVAATGSYPWFTADVTDRHYSSWVAWLERRTTKVPPRFRCFTPTLLRLLRGLLEPQPERRASVTLVFRCISEAWLVEGIDPLDIDLDESFSEILVDHPKSLLKEKLTRVDHPRHIAGRGPVVNVSLRTECV